ncbi:hypothetical protein SNEBB_010131 [Seison nebaliae]|nr:hypothetical protein SNEBB_010131 [Seison nebaliae]
MVMMGFKTTNKEKKGFSCNNHPGSSGCQNVLHFEDFSDFHNGSLILWNFYRLVYMKSNYHSAKKQCNFTDPLESMPKVKDIFNKLVRPKFLYDSDKGEESSKSSSFFNENDKGIWQRLKDYFCSLFNSIKNDRQTFFKTIEDYRKFHNVRSLFSSVLMLFLNSLFYENGGTRPKETIVHTFHVQNILEKPIELKHTSLFPLPSALYYDCVTYYPHLNLTYIKLTAMKNREKTEIKTYNIFFFLTLPWENDMFESTDEWFPQKTAELINEYGIPSTVIVDFREIIRMDPLVVQFAPWISVFNSFIDFIEKSASVELNDDINFIPTYKHLDIMYERAQFRFPESFWCKNEVCRKKLFQNCNVSIQQKVEEYELYAITLSSISHNYHLHTKFLFLSYISSDKLYDKEFVINRTNQLTNWLKGMPELKEAIENIKGNIIGDIYSHIERIIERIVQKETLYNLEQLNRIENGGVSVHTTERSGHSLVLIRTFNLRWWLINDDDVTQVDNLREFFNEPNHLLTTSPAATGWQRSTTSKYLRDKLRKFIKPIKNL